MASAARAAMTNAAPTSLRGVVPTTIISLTEGDSRIEITEWPTQVGQKRATSHDQGEAARLL